MSAVGRYRAHWSVWLGGIVIAVAGAAGAEPRKPLPGPAVIEIETPEMGVWVQRLLGRFALDGVIHHVDYVDPDRGGPQLVYNEWTQPMGGKADCIEFAEAPGIQCVINLAWPEVWNEMTGKAGMGGVPDMTPAMVLAGIDPDVQKLRFLMVSSRGFGYPGRAELKGNSAITRPSCVDLPGVQRCEQKVQVTAGADGRAFQVVVSTKARYMRNKKDRDPNDDSKPSFEWVDELLEVAFSVKPDESAAPDAGPVPAS
jgi:hypothetical protein